MGSDTQLPRCHNRRRGIRTTYTDILSIRRRTRRPMGPQKDDPIRTTSHRMHCHNRRNHHSYRSSINMDTADSRIRTRIGMVFSYARTTSDNPAASTRT